MLETEKASNRSLELIPETEAFHNLVLVEMVFVPNNYFMSKRIRTKICSKILKKTLFSNRHEALFHLPKIEPHALKIKSRPSGECHNLFESSITKFE